MRRLLGVVVAVLVAALGVPSAHAEGGYAPPVDGPIVDHFRPPPTPYAAGNRGIDYATAPGDEVRAAAAGQVVFAGQVGESLHVVVLHDDGLRTSYSFLADVAVHRGDRVQRGDVVGHAGPDLHFGVRAGDQYLDPEALLAGRPPDVHLIPVVDRTPGSIWSEAAGLALGLGGRVYRATATTVAFAADTTVATAARAARDAVVVIQVAGATVALPYHEGQRLGRGRLFLSSQRGCTPGSDPPPEHPGRGRILLLVAGLGSTSGHAAVDDVDAAGLGYDQVARFSYRGGQVEGTHPLAGVHTTTYTSEDSVADLGPVVDRFQRFLEEVRRAHPGVEVDVVAHSQGGVVARAALERPGPAYPQVDHLVTIGSPHHGATLATAGERIRQTQTGDDVAQVLDRDPAHAASPAVAQLAEDSPFIEALDDHPLPAAIRFTSIGAADDLVVPALQTPVAGATNVIVRVGDDVVAHDHLPGAAVTDRELHLALGDRGPTCHSVWGEVLQSEGIAAAEHVGGLQGTLVGAGIDLAVPRPGG